MAEFYPGKVNDEEIEKGVNGEGKMKTEAHHYHAHDAECNDMGHQLHRFPHEVYEKDKENEGEHTYPNEDDKEEKGEHTGEYPGFIRKLR